MSPDQRKQFLLQNAPAAYQASQQTGIPSENLLAQMAMGQNPSPSMPPQAIPITPAAYGSSAGIDEDWLDSYIKDLVKNA